MGDKVAWGLRQTPSNQLRNYIAQKHVPNASHVSDRVDRYTMALQVGAELAYRAAAKCRQEADLRALAAEIDEVMKEEEGVLLARYTARRPDGAGNRHPEYLGLQVVGKGPKWRAQSDYERAKSATPSSTMFKYCTPENPTGEPPRKGPEMRAQRPGFNFTYGAALASRIQPIRENNPTNDSGGIVLHSPPSLDTELVHISRWEWERKKVNGWCGFSGWGSMSSPGGGAETKPSSAPAPASAPSVPVSPPR